MSNLAPGPTPYVDLTASSPPRPVATVLHDAINTAHESRIRLALRNACDISGEVSRVVQEMLLVPEEKVKYRIVEKDLNSEGDVDEDESDEEEDDEDEDEDEDDEEEESKHKDTSHQTNGVSAPSLKRLRPRYAFCVNCKEEFDVADNEKDSCVWHPEGKEQDYDSDIWADHDEGCHGIIDMLVDDPTYAEGFMYSCCQRPSDSDGCKIGTHVEKESVYKKVRY